MKIEGLEMSEPVSTKSPSDILDAPIGGEDFRQALEIVTLLITTTQAGIRLADAAKAECDYT
jgi:hypothetical protein